MHRLLCLVFLFCAVAASARVARPNLTNHVIAANYDGLAVHPMTEEIFPTPEAFRDFVDLMLGNAETLAVEKGERSEDGRIKVKILIHVHGGLNLREHTTKRVETLSDTIKNEKVDWYYPIFVRWPSSFGSTYWEHLTSIRQGNKSPLWGPATMPVVLVTDTIQFIGHAPVDWFYQTVNTKDRMMSRFGWDCMVSENWEIALSNRDQPNVRWSGYYRTTGDSLKNTVLGIVGFPIRVTLGTLGQGTIAQASWNNMKRRTSQIVHPAPLFSKTEEHDAWRKKAAGEFFNILNERATTRTAEPSLFKYELYFVGHSMGAMVLNKIFTQYRREWIESRSVNRIVYMAAACSIGDGLEAIKPLLIAYNTNGVPLRFHNLTLNRVAEIAERSMWGVAPTGSLLEYIDQHLENPDAAINRTMGSEVNILTAIHLFDEVEDYCEFKGFDRDPRRLPAAHSDFNLCPFWWPSFWSVATEVSPGRNNYPKNWIKVHPAAKELPLQQQPAQAK